MADTTKTDNPFDKAEALQKEALDQQKADNAKVKEKAKPETDPATASQKDTK